MPTEKIRIDLVQMEAIRRLALKEGVPMTKIVKKALELYLKNRKPSIIPRLARKPRRMAFKAHR
jgi:hypothetical protein